MTERLSPVQARVLAAAADGAPLSVVAARLGTTRTQVASRLSEAYRRLDVTWLPRGEKRAEAVRVARGHGLIPPEAASGPVGAPQGSEAPRVHRGRERPPGAHQGAEKEAA
jgi:DNA-binding CsgD family transcriptional regulator